MATTDSELIDEVRGLIGYDSTVISDSEFQTIVDTAKEELRATLEDPSFTFYQTGNESTHQADRALFWFVCIGAKIHTGELAGMNMQVDELRMEHPGHIHHEVYFDRFRQYLSRAEDNHSEVSGASQVELSRTDRTYGE